MTSNLNRSDRVLRFIIALLLLTYAGWQNSRIALTLSLFIFFEVYMNWCVIYQLLGINHCPIKKKDKSPMNKK